MDPATAALNALAKFFEFLCTAEGQKLAGQVFKDGEDLRKQFAAWHDKAAAGDKAAAIAAKT